MGSFDVENGEPLAIQYIPIFLLRNKSSLDRGVEDKKEENHYYFKVLVNETENPEGVKFRLFPAGIANNRHSSARRRKHTMS